MGVVLAALAGCTIPGPRFEPTPTLEKPAFGAGRGVGELARPPAEVLGVLGDALQDLKITETSRARDGLDFRINARTEDDRSVQVTVKPQKGNTRVACRVGWFGDEPLSLAVIERIGVRLGTRPPAAIPETPPSRPAPNPFFAKGAPDDEMIRNFADAPYRGQVVP